MRIAVFSDIHGNLHALQAVIEDIDKQKPDLVYCLGDLVGYGAFPNEVIDLIRSRQIPALMGNYDEGVGFGKDDCGCAYRTPEHRAMGDKSLAWSKARVTEENKAFLRTMSTPYLELQAEGRKLIFTHGSPRKINEYLFEDRPLSSFERIADAFPCDILFCGHTHMPYQKQVGKTLFINDGSVGKPKDGDPRAGYVIIDLGKDVKAVQHRVVYDVAAAAAAVRAVPELPDEFAEMLEKAAG